MSKSASLKILGLKLVKLGCIIIKLDIDTIKKVRNGLDGLWLASCLNLEPDANMKFEQNIDMKMYINHNLTINFPQNFKLIFYRFIFTVEV